LSALRNRLVGVRRVKGAEGRKREKSKKKKNTDRGETEGFASAGNGKAEKGRMKWGKPNHPEKEALPGREKRENGRRWR